jgi:16S rRNA (uracil1498-N3)-methyltransferase
MQLFYSANFEGNLAFFDENESKHCIQVLRHQMGDEISFLDGKGKIYSGFIVEAGKKSMTVKVEKTATIPGRNYQLSIAIAPPKSIDRFEFFLEKATEIGIDRIFPVFTDHSERKKLRIDRCEKVLMAAMKQCMTPNLPKIEEAQKLSSFFDSMGNYEQHLIGYCGEEGLPLLKNQVIPGKSTIILIGPEGDFSPNEFEKAKELGFIGVSMGHTRLRTETAAIMATATVAIVNQ